ncbi:tRNA (adenosine(37)-N6)-threonylcarbamoyltransferase complex dimerization subunit type 1 TsaB [Pedobacter sp. HMF7647]|uniref:tRNA (Adenosine(37)-N6)-threonylcarbamoyltransferase complex dimerization subunit type 1 TsaB n=1 Tax=Hufsiella arboris TaxID=2695275 RepID=A0A7K1YDT9_9SPHI|nr:tRNA (adenosine(37)-N6)-threonylcarbamoyltransferase complex dimerization subunit type 1 TsaB [Hufsiella arboris]MXV52229.1 tRNA (adenosine(37)-N6)-threonylcarbamoyltransferase complex dimerization subunit type 1 TsaB [Hufsiella arboris]
MALILQIETATATCSVALSENGSLLAYKEQTDRNIHASNLTLFIQQVMKDAGKQLAELNAVAVSKGPGSYTGLRIGVSTAKGLCYALDIPLISVNTLQSMAAMIAAETGEERLLCPMIDARRMEVYTAVYDHNLDEVMATEAMILDENSFSVLLEKHELVFFGDGCEKLSAILKHENASFVNDFQNSARGMNLLAFEKFSNQQFENTAYFDPYYLKEFIALQPKKAN